MIVLHKNTVKATADTLASLFRDCSLSNIHRSTEKPAEAGLTGFSRESISNGRHLLLAQSPGLAKKLYF